MERKSKIIACAVPVILALLGLVAYEYGYERVRSRLASTKETEKVKIRMLEKYMSIIAERPLLEQRLASLKEKRKTGDSKIIGGKTPALSASTLQETVKGIIVGRGGSISSERVEKPDELGKFRVLNVSLDLVLPDTRALSDVVYSIETRTPYIIIRELDVRVKDFRDPRELMIKLKVAALTGGK